MERDSPSGMILASTGLQLNTQYRASNVGITDADDTATGTGMRTLQPSATVADATGARFIWQSSNFHGNGSATDDITAPENTAIANVFL